MNIKTIARAIFASCTISLFAFAEEGNGQIAPSPSSSASNTSESSVLTAGMLRLGLDGAGKVTGVAGPDGKNWQDPARASHLLMLKAYGDRAFRTPIGMRREPLADGRVRLIFSYDGGFTATVEATPRAGYLRLELTHADPVEKIVMISWGPLNTVMKEPIGDYLGLIRGGDFTAGMLSLNPNTDGECVNGGHYLVARFNGFAGSRLQAYSYDHSQPNCGQNRYKATPVAGVTVKSSAVALFGCSRAKELDVIESIAIGEKLPYPTAKGVWVKRATAHLAPSIWVHYKPENLDKWLEISQQFGASRICNFHDMFANWGHFEPDAKFYPQGLTSLRETELKCEKVGIGHVMYTLSTFLCPRTKPEPYISPVMRPDFQKGANPVNGRSYCPGTIAFQDEVTDNMVKIMKTAGFPQITIDGYESCLRTGHGSYAKNLFSKRLFDGVGKQELTITGSCSGNYDWHLMSYISWGEYDKVKGFRGTMLDYRLRRQVQLADNHMPHKLGQHYPDDATPEDIEWLMARAAGWDAGVELHFEKPLSYNSQRTTLAPIVKLWSEAQQANAFTEEQKLGLRQTDRLYTLSRGAAGKYDLRFVRRWQNPKVKILPPSAFTLSAAAPSAKIEPCGITWEWTHNPGIFVNCGLSDDLVAAAGQKAVWQVKYPHNDILLFVIRLPADAPCAVRNPTVILNGNTKLVIPVTLQPGQYLSTTHDMSRVSIYNDKHDVIAEASIQCIDYRLPTVPGAKPQTIELTAEPVKDGAAPILHLNLRNQRHIGGYL